MTNGERTRSVLYGVGLAFLLSMLAGCGFFQPEPTPTPSLTALPTARATATIIVPTPPPGATLTAMVAAYRRTLTPGAVQTATATPAAPHVPGQPTATQTPSPITGASIYAVPELVEPGNPVEVRGANWEPEEKVTLSLGTSVETARVTEPVGTVRWNGTFAASLLIPEDWPGDNAVIVAESADGQRRAVTRLFIIGPTPTSTVEPTSTPLPATATATATDTPQPSPSPTPEPTATPTRQFRGWRGEYYANPDLEGTPAVVRDDQAIDFDWGSSAPEPAVPLDGFSVRWTREIDFSAGGYQFSVEVDDGVRIFFDDTLVLDEWRVTSLTSYEFQRVLDGPTEIRVEYFDAGGNASIRFQWDYLGRYPNWRGAYYNNRNLSGSPALIRNDLEIDFAWGEDSPAPQIQPDNFSARWTRTTTLDAGTHRFHARADDGVRVWVDSQIIIDEWYTSPADQEFTGDVYLFSGRHNVRIEYFEAGGNAEVYVWWENLDAYPDWRSAYFDNRTLSRTPALIRNDFDIDFDWGDGGPDDVGPDDFSVEWIDRRNFFEEGVVRFYAEHDDGVRIWVNGRQIVDEWYVTGPMTHHGDIQLVRGTHEVRVAYFEAGGNAKIRVWWEVGPIQ